MPYKKEMGATRAKGKTDATVRKRVGTTRTEDRAVQKGDGRDACEGKADATVRKREGATRANGRPRKALEKAAGKNDTGCTLHKRRGKQDQV